ncbi:MAG: hypothetical protein HGA65_20220 [Oscillochloris sp.]|nr:hypothetical protein [Oscillochloris sp.]
MKTPHFILIALVVLCLVPYGWLVRLSPVSYQLFNALFDTLPAHIVGHSLIFALIGTLALWLFPALRRRPIIYAALILAAACGQEGFQVLYKGRLYLIDTLLDLLVDAIAATVVWIMVYVRSPGVTAGRSPSA